MTNNRRTRLRSPTLLGPPPLMNINIALVPAAVAEHRHLLGAAVAEHQHRREADPRRWSLICSDPDPVRSYDGFYDDG